jgi:A/G-specific adenine glycosylase
MHLGVVSDLMLDWGKKNKRKFPWRNTRNPYKVLVAEVLLHRTQANQVIPVYNSLLTRYPNIKDLAKGHDSEVLKILYPIGLHWRSKLLLTMANEIVSQFNGNIPEELEKLKSLSGVSDYIASATRCFGFGYPDILLDTNTVRVVGRITGLEINDSSRRSSNFRNILETFIDKDYPKEFNWALIDFAAIVCKSRKPDHLKCPFTNYCKYYTLQA